MTQTETWTVGRLLTWTTDYLKQQGVEGARLDAEILLAEARGCRRIDLYASFAEPASDETRAAFRELVRRRAEGTPVAYLVGRREFYSLPFRVTPDVLIPRPETEFLVVALLDRIKQGRFDGPIRIADVGTGSGIIAVCAAKHASAARVTAIDIHRPALAVAATNVADHGVAERIELIQSDLFASLPAERRFDFVVSNPPYVSTSEMALLAPEVRDHEPQVALLAGERGTDVIERLLPQAAERLAPGGWLLLEISPMLAQTVERLIAAQGAFELAPTIKDLAGLPRVAQARRVAQ